MRKQILGFCAFGLILVLGSCASKPSGEQQHATITMRDGTTVSGTVTASSSTQITVSGDDQVVRTIPMSQVKSVEYGDSTAGAPPTQAAAPPTQAAAPPMPAPSSPPVRSSAPPARVPETAPAHEDHYHPEPSAIRSRTYRLQVGTEVPVRLEETVDSGRAVEGQTYAAEVTQNVADAEGNVVIPRGSNAQVIIKSSSRGGRFRGASDLVLDLQSVSIGGQRYQIETADMQERGKSGIGGNKRTAEYTGGGAAVGAIIGALAGHGKGAAIGAGAGAGAGALTQILTKGGAIRVPAETILTFKLDQPLHVVAAR